MLHATRATAGVCAISLRRFRECDLQDKNNLICLSLFPLPRALLRKGASMKRIATLAITTCLVAAAVLTSAGQPASSAKTFDGRQVFRFDTFGDEQLWTDTLQLQQSIASVSPRTALQVGLKVDSEMLPPHVVDALKTGQVDLDDPAVTIQLLELNAVVGVIGRVIGGGDLKSVGVTCALCHSTVDNSLTAGIGKRLD